MLTNQSETNNERKKRQNNSLQKTYSVELVRISQVTHRTGQVLKLQCGIIRCHHVKDVQSRSRVTPEWKGFDNKMGTTLASAHALCLNLLSHVWLCISGGLNCCQEFWRGMV